MAILVVWSSPNMDGLTASAKNQIVSGIEAAGREVEVIHLNCKHINMCKACGNGWGTCLSDGVCILKDDFADVYNAFQRADAIVLITPVYWHDMSENMKALLDRMRRCEPFHNHYLAEKRCMLIACAGGTGKGAVKCLRTMEETLGHMKMIPLERLPIIRFNKDYMLPALAGAGRMFAEHYADWK